MKNSKFRLSLRFALAIVGAATSIITASQVFGDFLLTDWRYVKPVLLPVELRERGFIKLHPDVELFAGTARGLVDVRIIDEDGSEIPYKIEVSDGERQRVSRAASIRDKSYVSDTYTTFTVDLDREGIPHNRIEFQTPNSNFRREATVETSNDAISWDRIAEQLVYDFTVSRVGRVARDTEILYPDTTSRYLRVRIAYQGEGPIEVSGAAVFFMKETPAREVSWPISIPTSSQDADRRVTLVELDLGVEGLPTHRLELDIPDVNFYRDISVEMSSDSETWQASELRTAIYAFDTPKFVGDSVEITHPESTFRYLRLVIFDQDNPPLTVDDVDVWGYERRIVFSVDPARSYSVYYGNATARPPAYDIEHVLPYLATENLPQAELGPQSETPGFVEATELSERFPWLLPLVVGLAAVVVGFILFGVLRNARKILRPPTESVRDQRMGKKSP